MLNRNGPLISQNYTSMVPSWPTIPRLSCMISHSALVAVDFCSPLKIKIYLLSIADKLTRVLMVQDMSPQRVVMALKLKVKIKRIHI